MKILSINWSSNTDNTKITFTDDFLQADRITKLDVLQDIGVMIDEIYSDTLAQIEEGTSFIDKTYKRYE